MLLLRVSLALLLSVLFAGTVAVSFTTAAPVKFALSADGEFPSVVDASVRGRSESLKYTGSAVRKRLGIPFFRIAAYCDSDVRPADVDAMAAADVPKRLILVMQRDIPDSLFRKGFGDAFSFNDPKDEFVADREKLLNHLTARPLVKGDYITLTHVPSVGLDCQVGEGETLTIPGCGFAHVVWNVYMGPKACSPDVREGLGTELARD